MISRSRLTLVAALGLLGAYGTIEARPRETERVTVTARAVPSARAPLPEPRDALAAPVSTAPDSALAELAAGRYWHAARLLREAGAEDGSAADRLALARAEAGWTNWPAVVELLEGASWLREVEGGVGLYLLARALEESDRPADASVVYRAYVADHGTASTLGLAALARSARTFSRAGRHDEALEALVALRMSPVLRSWMAVELSLAAVDEADPDLVRALGTHVIEPRAAATVWRAEADALLARGDSIAGRVAFEALAQRTTGDRRSVALIELGRLALAAADTSEAERLLQAGYAEAPGSGRIRAAEALHDIGGHDLGLTLELSRLLDRAGDGRRALQGYDRAVRLAAEADTLFPEWSRLERARLMATVDGRQAEALEEFRAIRETTEDPRIGARNLDVWTQMRRRQGQSAAVSTLRRWLLDEYPSSSEAVEIMWASGSDAEGSGRLDDALRHYGRLTELGGSQNRAGEARMRTGQIHLRRADERSAAEVFERYLADFPDGRRWPEASYWAGRTRLELGDSAAGRAHLERVLRQPAEYYAVMAAELLGVPYEVDLPEGPDPVEPGWMTEGLARLDLLDEAGLARGAQDEIERLEERAESDRRVRIRLARALIERGRTIDGINLGWAILADDGTWDKQLLRVTYPFPYEELVRREAAEWGVDVFVMAAIIRQESAFEPDIVSRAGAVGLMQVMPPTGAQLARAHGPQGFTPESLTKPEVNLHLGAAYFVEMNRRYENDLPLVLSAYNAGPTRATRWRRYPEVSDALRFTERIPFDETRGYVKAVRRNMGLYRVLYGQD